MGSSSTNKSNSAPQAEPNVNLWSRDGFSGLNAISLQPGYAPEFLSVEGLHVPRRIRIADVPAEDERNPDALPTPILTSKVGIALNVSKRRKPMPFTLRNVEADELHFVQFGRVRFDTELGSIEAAEDEFVCVPRSVGYRVTPLSDNFLALIMESPGALKFDTPAPFGMIDFGRDVRRATIAPPAGPPANGSGKHVMVLKAADGITRFVKTSDPLMTLAQVGGEPPVWALKLTAIQGVSYGGLGGPPSQFLASPASMMLFFGLSARASKLRPPVHHNADYDELILYTRGPGAYGQIAEPGTLTIVPKGVTHHGPPEEVPEGYNAFLLETRATLRFTAEAAPYARLMETGEYGVHPNAL
jgi:homogentisate 1,2-dioxygenase